MQFIEDIHGGYWPIRNIRYIGESIEEDWCLSGPKSKKLKLRYVFMNQDEKGVPVLEKNISHLIKCD